MKSKNMYFIAGQLSMAIGVLLDVFVKDSRPISFVSGFFIGLSLVFNVTFAFGLRKNTAS
jgi:hypothetical protein